LFFSFPENPALRIDTLVKAADYQFFSSKVSRRRPLSRLSYGCARRFPIFNSDKFPGLNLSINVDCLPFRIDSKSFPEILIHQRKIRKIFNKRRRSRSPRVSKGGIFTLSNPPARNLRAE
jgi:hypothetical protein